MVTNRHIDILICLQYCDPSSKKDYVLDSQFLHIDNKYRFRRRHDRFTVLDSRTFPVITSSDN